MNVSEFQSFDVSSSAPSKLRTRKTSKGFTLVEIAIVLGVFAVIMAGIWMVVAVVYENVRQYQAGRQLQTIVQNTRQLYSRISTFTSGPDTDLTVILDRQDAFPVEMRMNPTANPRDGKLNNPWSSGGTGATVVVGSNPTEFDVTFAGLPKKSCISLGAKYSSGDIGGLSGMKVNGTAVDPTTLPLTPVSAGVLCTGAGNTNSVTWRFALRE